MIAVIYNKIKTQNVNFDSTKLPKHYNIIPGSYTIEFKTDNNHIITALNLQLDSKIEEKNRNKIIQLINELFYAAKGYKDCEMQPAKFNRLMNCFTYNSQVIDYFL